MTLGVDVRTRTASVPRGTPVDTGTWFVVGAAGSGPTDATLVQSIGDFALQFGDRAVANDELYDAVDAYFAEGGKRAYVARQQGTLADALALFDPLLGPGQVSAPGAPAGAATHAALLAHAKDNNRVAIMDVNVDTTVASASGIGLAARADGNAEYGGVFGSWVDIPAPAGVSGASARQVPASPIVAALCARADALGNPNRAAAGRDFPLQYVTGFDVDFTSAEREALLNAGVNTFADVFGVLENYGFQTAVEQSQDNPYWQLNAARARMWLKAKAKAVGEPYVFRTIDAKNRLAHALRGDIEDVCLQLYGVDGLFGETPQEAFAVNVGASVNTVDSIAQGELHAVVEARLSLHAKAVLIDLVTVPLTGQVSTGQ